jgi:RND family efflux transporter MFP subunit
VQTVTTTQVKKQDFPVTLDTTGNTLAVSVVDIRPQVTNVVAKIHVKEGQMVKKGDLLFSLDDRADRANYEKAMATAEDAKRQLSRAQELVKQQFVSQSAADTAQSNAQAAIAAANAAQAVLSYDQRVPGRLGAAWQHGLHHDHGHGHHCPRGDGNGDAARPHQRAVHHS